MKTIRVNVSSPYDVVIERGILKECGKLIGGITKSRKTVIITDDIVEALYCDAVEKSLAENGFSFSRFVFPNGEASKNSETLNKIYDFLSQNEITRKDIIIALGGGVTGDMAGFAAATYLRGVDFVQIPTTLLAQIDSSVGGKTAIDIPAGKNLVGAFKQPALVICDSDTLKTLSPEILADGMAEAIKYGMIKDSNLFDKIAERNLDTIEEIMDELVYSCIDIKRQVVEADEFEGGERMILNFGHTLGHAVEGFYNYKTYTHGSGVAVGMCYITKKFCDYGIYEKLAECVKAYRLPVEVPAKMSELLPFCTKDKKRDMNSISYIVCRKIGVAEICKSTVDEFIEVMGE